MIPAYSREDFEPRTIRTTRLKLYRYCTCAVHYIVRVPVSVGALEAGQTVEGSTTEFVRGSCESAPIFGRIATNPRKSHAERRGAGSSTARSPFVGQQGYRWLVTRKIWRRRTAECTQAWRWSQCVCCSTTLSNIKGSLICQVQVECPARLGTRTQIIDPRSCCCAQNVQRARLGPQWLNRCARA